MLIQGCCREVRDEELTRYHNCDNIMIQYKAFGGAYDSD